MSRTVIHIDITDFHIAVERVLEPRLQQRPVAVAVETQARSLVFASSQEARQNGVYRGMSLYQAVKNCPDLTILPPNEDLYARATHAMMKVIGRLQIGDHEPGRRFQGMNEVAALEPIPALRVGYRFGLVKHQLFPVHRQGHLLAGDGREDCKEEYKKTDP